MDRLRNFPRSLSVRRVLVADRRFFDHVTAANPLASLVSRQLDTHGNLRYTHSNRFDTMALFTDNETISIFNE